MFRLFGLLLVGLVLAGCGNTTGMIENNDIQIGMSKLISKAIYFGMRAFNDPAMVAFGGSGYSPNFHEHTIVYGANKKHIFVFDPSDLLIAVTKVSLKPKS